MRGLTWWTDGKESRLFTAAANFIYAINPADGTAITTFGDEGRIDLRENLRGAPRDNSYHATSPAVIYKDLLILGGRVSERTPASPGDQRAYDVRTGATPVVVPHHPGAGRARAETWPAERTRARSRAERTRGRAPSLTRSAASSSSPPVHRPTISTESIGPATISTATASSRSTPTPGKKLWHFQATRHDLWDSDFAAPPILLTVNSNGRRVDAVAATNKFGFIYIFDRVTGESLFPMRR